MTKPLAATNHAGSAGVWSAAPTPLTDRGQIDGVALRRMIAHHQRLGVSGLFLAGTNGEGPFLPQREIETLVKETVAAVGGSLPIAVQVTDNSAARNLERIDAIAGWGADIAVVAQPYFIVNGTPARIRDYYLETIRGSRLPIGLYDRGVNAPFPIPERLLSVLYREPKVCMIKDSSRDPRRRALALAARQRRNQLVLMNGDEFDCAAYLAAGYNGLLLGGGAFNAMLAGQIVAAVRANDQALAQRLQERMNNAMWTIYGGRRITCWLAGEKYLLTRLGIFRGWNNLPGYALTAACRRGIDRLIERERDWLMPPPATSRKAAATTRK